MPIWFFTAFYAAIWIYALALCLWWLVPPRRVPHPNSSHIEIGASRRECLNDRSSIRIIPGPIREEMQRRPPTAFRILDYAPGKPGIALNQLIQSLDVALLEGGRELRRESSIIHSGVNISCLRVGHAAVTVLRRSA